METLKKTLFVPPNHKLKLDITLPATFPSGETEVILIFAPKQVTDVSDRANRLKKLSGQLKNSPHFGQDPLIFQKVLRDEWKN